MANNFFTICSLFYIVMLTIVYFNRKNLKTIETKIYSLLIITNLLNVVFAISCYFSITAKELAPFFNNFVSKTLLIIFFTWGLIFTGYVVLVTSKNTKKLKDNTEKIKKIMIAILFLVGVTIYSLPLYYFNENRVVYSYGPAANLVYVSYGIFIFAWLIKIITNFQVIKNKKMIPIIIFIILILVVVSIQKTHPGLLLTTATGTFVTVLMYFTIENPDLKLLNELHKSKEISDKANEEKTLFLYNMNQEIRNTTNEIDNYANLILDSDSIEESKDSARNIKSIISKFNNESNEILNMTDTNSTNIKVYNSKYNIKTVIKEIVNIYDNMCKNKELKFITNIDHDIPSSLYGDSISLKEVLNIILNNGIKYTNKGYIEFNVNTVVKNDICRLIFTIEDSGSGIKSEEINKIKLNEKSLGKANKLVTMMNGTMIISSDFGIGTKIKIVLDQKIAEDEENEIEKFEHIYNNTKILAIDDSDSGLQIIEKLLKDSNINLETSTNGKDAINKIKTDKFDLILLDEDLSSITGSELLIKMKEIRNFNTKVILLTKDNSNEYKEEYKKWGFEDYLLKPLKKEILLEKINKYVQEDK